MHLIEILLPITDGFRREAAALEGRLITKFGGVTAFTRSPGEGLWDSGSSVVRDEIIVLEVMAQELDRAWWSDLRADLETRLRENKIVIRVHSVVEM